MMFLFLIKSVLIFWYKLKTANIDLNPLMIITRYNPDMTNQRINSVEMKYAGVSALMIVNPTPVAESTGTISGFLRITIAFQVIPFYIAFHPNLYIYFSDAG